MTYMKKACYALSIIDYTLILMMYAAHSLSMNFFILGGLYT